MMRIALGLEYAGGRYCGWQTQDNRGAVQDYLESALSQIADHRVATLCAGRTDTGVHALAQVVHFDTEVERPDSAWVRGVNALLPPDIAVTWMRRVDERFHARFSARARHYTYVLLNHPVREAIDYGRVGWFHRPLNVSDMRLAAEHLLGKQDFSAFRSSQCQAKTALRELSQLALHWQAPYLYFDFTANAFLHHMVRNIVGALVYVGKGKYEPDWVKGLLAQKDRRLSAPTFEAAGLYLIGVDYDWQWSPTLDERVKYPRMNASR
ncbi:MAG: tRNA pseudouridine(38-40) synthase TruA [Betaproteobacteria bacterium]